jgi:glutamate racemase
VPLVESGAWTGPDARAVVTAALAPFRAAPPAALVLGCTHYPHLAALIAEVLPGVALVDPAAGVVARAEAILGAREMLASGAEAPERRFLVSGDPEKFFTSARALLPGVVDGVQQVPLAPAPVA